ncbi:MAG: type II toxin-antitoxin system Phd/YefM family antitoxin [Clostridia bacterium]|nr:type II toxin-antitoxin system Phd/YefM family antitoxin [Clostridia bacterium]
MIDIRPETDLMENFDSIKRTVKSGNPVYLTENGYGTMVVLSLEQYSSLMISSSFTEDEEEAILDECDRRAKESTRRYSHEQISEKLRRSLNGE